VVNPEYIVVGSGAGGGPLAARLAELGHRVLLLEAGGDEEPWNYQVPVFHGLATEDEDMRLDHYVRHYADERRQERDPKYERERSGVLYPRARTLGGCTAHYAMIIIRPHNSDWQAIRDATGDASWAPAAMNKYFKTVERCLYLPRGASGEHGESGWLPTRFSDTLDFVQALLREQDTAIAEIASDATKAAGVRTGEQLAKASGRGDAKHSGSADPFDPNNLSTLGQDIIPLRIPTAIDKAADKGERPGGRRAGTRERIRAAAKATGRLEVRLHSHVTKLMFDENDPNRVTGVVYVEGKRLYRADRDGTLGVPGEEVKVHAEREVILSAGAFITPQLLMLSGIGPAAALRSLGIDVRQDLPGVGANLQDRYEVGIVAKADEPFRILQKATFEGPAAENAGGDELFENWRKEGEGLYATNGAVLGFIRRSRVAENGEPDQFIFGVPGRFDGYYTGWSREAVKKPHDKWTWLLLKGHTRFSGSVALRTANPFDPPDIDFNYFPRTPDGALTPGAAADLEAMRDGVRLVKRLIDSSKRLRLHPELMRDVDLQTDAGIDAFVQDRAWGHHASCTCKIGGDTDRSAVLDSSFRVRGIRGLRVVDASVFPKIPGFFIAMPIYMVSEKAAEVIHADSQASR
jgi:choline dehydrogenase